MIKVIRRYLKIRELRMNLQVIGKINGKWYWLHDCYACGSLFERTLVDDLIAGKGHGVGMYCDSCLELHALKSGRA